MQAAKGVKAYDKAEDPIYALEHNLPIDFQHYLDHHLELPLTRLFGPVMNNPKELMTGQGSHGLTGTLVSDRPVYCASCPLCPEHLHKQLVRVRVEHMCHAAAKRQAQVSHLIPESPLTMPYAQMSMPFCSSSHV